MHDIRQVPALYRDKFIPWRHKNRVATAHIFQSHAVFELQQARHRPFKRGPDVINGAYRALGYLDIFSECCRMRFGLRAESGLVDAGYVVVEIDECRK